MGTCCVTGLQSKSRESQAGSPCMGTAHPFLRAAQCSGAGTCSRSRVGGLRRPALRARILESIRKRGPARYSLAAASHTGAPGSGGGRSVAGGLRLHVHRALPAGGSRGVLSPVGWSGHPARPMGGHLLQRTGRTGLGGTGSPAQGVFGVSCKAKGRPPSSESRANRPGGSGESCPGGVWSLLPGQGGATFFREPGAPTQGGRGVLSRGCSESPARSMGGHLLQRTGHTGPGGTGSSAQGVFGVSCQAKGGSSSS